jgi:hypothetical protein
MVEIETFNLKDIHHDDNVSNLEMGNLVKVSGLVVGSISNLLDHKQQMLQKTLKHQATWMWKLQLHGRY